MSGKPQDIKGQRFGRFTVLEYVGDQKWLCQCDCGTIKKVIGPRLRSGEIKSCRCLQREKVAERGTKHGLSNTRLYKIWGNMKQRCYNPNASKYYLYGGSGVKVCNEWLDFMNFYEWSLANGYTDNLSIDRIDSSKDYEPSNCRWVTYKVQGNNTRANHYLEYMGERKTMAEWAEAVGLPYKVLSERIRRKWNVERALTTPVLQIENFGVFINELKAISS